MDLEIQKENAVWPGLRQPIGKSQMYALLVDASGNPVLDADDNKQVVAIQSTNGRMQVDASISGSLANENPYYTAEGQNVVSVAEPWVSRLSREGIMVFSYSQGIATSNTFTSISDYILAGIDRRFYPLRISVSCTVLTRVSIRISNLTYGRSLNPNNSMATDYYDSFFVAPGANVERVYKGELWIEGKMGLGLKHQTINTGETGIMDISMMGWEVSL